MGKASREISGKFFPELEEFRAGLSKGLYNEYKGFAYRCLVFYYDMQASLFEGHPEKYKIDAFLHVYRTSAMVMAQYDALVSDEIEVRRFPQLALFGALHCISQTVEATAGFCGLFSLEEDIKLLKSREYWQFRKSHAHVEVSRHNKSVKPEDRYDIHVFPLETSTATSVRYQSFNQDRSGYRIKVASMKHMFRDLDWDLKAIFSHLTEAARTHAAEAKKGNPARK